MRIIALVPRSVHSLLMVWLVALKPVSTLETEIFGLQISSSWERNTSSRRLTSGFSRDLLAPSGLQPYRPYVKRLNPAMHNDCIITPLWSYLPSS